MRLQPGVRLGSYEIHSALGAGGMGEVYRAHDTKLKRDVAIKILPAEFSADPERVGRLQREAEALASINHSNIAAIYDLAEHGGTQFLVMELVEGTTLAEKLTHGSGLTAQGRSHGSGPSEGSRPKTQGSGEAHSSHALEPLAMSPKPSGGLPVSEALDIARQIASALEAAHERGVVHRDLKPANIKITPGGQVKVLDFGLAKLVVAPLATGSDVGYTQSPTVMGGTTAGVILGTAAYMSPEQARGLPVDRGTDIWAFGCVLFEILTGRRAFDGDTVTDILGAIVRGEPDWRALPAGLPAHANRLLRRCLEKDRRRRLRDAGDVWLELDEPPSEPIDRRASSRAGGRLGWIAAAVFGLVAAAFAIWSFRPAAPAPELRVDIATPPTPDPLSLAIAPDGGKVAFVATGGGPSRLWVRSIDSTASQPLAGTDGALYPFWSPDGRAVGFFAEGKLKRIDLSGGPPQVLAAANGPRGGAWSRDGVILFAPNATGGLFRVAATGGEPTQVTRVDAPRQISHRFPHFLPDGRRFLFFAQGGSEGQGVHAASLDQPGMQRLVDADAAAMFAPSGFLVFVRQGTLFAQRFDPKGLTLSGEPHRVAPQVAVDATVNCAALAVSATGPIIYRAGAASGPRQLVWFDRAGNAVGSAGSPDPETATNPELSPDGARVALNRAVRGNVDIWVVEAARGGLTRLTFDRGVDQFPVWSRDGRWIVFNSNRNGAYDLFRKPAGGGGSEELLVSTPINKVPLDWSPDGRHLLYRVSDPKTGQDVWALPLDGDRKAVPIVQQSADERDAQFSPDGNWIAYQSNETGQAEIYVQPFPGSGGKWQITTTGGAQPRWHPNGRELFYIGLDGTLTTVPVRIDSKVRTVEPGSPAALFAPRMVGGPLPGPFRQQYAVSRDGQRFLINTLTEEVSSTPITLLLNWKAGQ
ncbi:MAG: serine/threonine-protein kinase [Acidobacteria bacterium]|nr:serine/threonine-protein kinase [Acidobacteriota bacterium]